MTDELPPLRDLPPGRLDARRRHLLAEIRRTPARRGWQRPLLVAAAAAATVTAVAYALLPSPSREPAFPTALTRPYAVHASLPLPSEDSLAFRYGSASAGLVSPAAYHSSGDSTVWADAAIPRRALVLAGREAAWNGDPHPARVEWVRTTRQRAVSAQSTDRVDSPRRAVWFVFMEGHFVDRHAMFIGRRAPRGSVLGVTIDVRRGVVLDVTLGRTRPSLARTGKSHLVGLVGSGR